jgi:hypothetical protein
MGNPEGEVKEESLWTEGDESEHWCQKSAAEAHSTPEGKGMATLAEGQKQSPVIEILRQFSPDNLGCLIVALIAGILIASVGKDLPHLLLGVQGAGNAPPAAVTTPAPSRSLILLGTWRAGVIYFNGPTGIFYRDATFTTKSIALLPDFEEFHWSPHRNKIAFVVRDRNDTMPLLYVLDLTNTPPDGQLTLITRRDPNGFPAEFGLRAESPVAWSQDEQYIAFTAYDQTGKAALFVSEVTTGKVRRLTEGTEPVTSVAWETYRNDRDVEDERIVYVLIRGGKELIYSVEKNGAENNPWRH